MNGLVLRIALLVISTACSLIHVTNGVYPGKLVALNVAAGNVIEAGEALFVVEAMKARVEVFADLKEHGLSQMDLLEVVEVHAEEGDSLPAHTPVLTLKRWSQSQ